MNPVVYSSVYRANVNPARDTDFHGKLVYAAPGNVQQLICCETSLASNASANIHVKHTSVSEAGKANVKEINVKQACESKPNVKPLYFDNGINSLSSSSHVTMGEDFHQTSPNMAQGMSDPTAKVISSHGVSVDVNMLKSVINDQPITAAKVVSTPGVEGECSDVTFDKSIPVTSTKLINIANDTQIDFRQMQRLISL